MNKKAKNKPEEKVYGDPVYSANEDIYSQGKKEELSDSEEDPKTAKSAKRVPKDRLSDDLDVPGAELDDKDEEIGEEDEENNYYSLGGDDHNDLEEDKGD